MSTFNQMPLLPEIQESLNLLGFTQPTEIQKKIIPYLLENPVTDVHAQAQTGTGKTLAFGIPLLQLIDPSNKSVQGLVVAPTRELVLQIYEQLKDASRKTNISIEPVYGGMSIDRQIKSIKRGAQIIIGTPGRLNDHLRRKTLSLKNLKVLVLDEADIMLDMGFKEEIDAILNYTPKNRPIWLFSATVRPGIKSLIKSHMSNVYVVRAAAKKGVVSTDVKQYYCIVPKRNRIEVLGRFIQAASDFYGIVFCQTKSLTNEVMEELVSRGFRANCLHGDMKQALRNQVIKGFKNKDFNILVATDVAGRGIDVSDLSHVINYSLPRETESYIHRIGRTGRAGKQGIAIVFIAPSELGRVRRLEKSIGSSIHEIAVPPLEAIINVKMGVVSDFIEQAKKPDKELSKVHTVIKELINSFSEEEIRNALAVALEDKFFKSLTQFDNLKEIKPKLGVVPQEICIEIGRDNGYSEDDMRDYLYSVCELLPQEINKVRVLNKKTFISIPENRLKNCVDALKKNPISDRKHKVYLVEDVYRSKRTSGKKRSRTSQKRRLKKKSRKKF